ncbi:MAG: hypothetical protein RR439_02140 [Carnobacterium sp.]
MNDKMLTFFIITLTTIVISVIARYIRNKVYKPKYENGVQKPGKLEGFIITILILIATLLALMAVLGVSMKVLALFLFAIIVLLKQALKVSYQENTDYFILKSKNKEYQVFYENIVDWQPALNEIAILDKSRTDEKYVKINIKLFKPEILLRKIADRTFEGKLYSSDKDYLEGASKETEIVHYLVNNNYGYLIKDYIEEVEDRFL